MRVGLGTCASRLPSQCRITPRSPTSQPSSAVRIAASRSTRWHGSGEPSGTHCHSYGLKVGDGEEIGVRIRVGVRVTVGVSVGRGDGLESGVKLGRLIPE